MSEEQVEYRVPKSMKPILTDTPTEDIVYGLPFEEYKAIPPALNPSTIVECVKSPLHTWHAWNKPRDDTPSMQKGRALHSALLEPRIFGERYEPAEQRRTAKYVEAARERGIELLLPQDFESIVESARRASLCTQLQQFIRRGNAEVSILTGEHGCQCKGRLDWISTDPLAILDVKTTRNISARSFSRDFYSLGYDIKLGLYQRWLKRLLKANDIPVYLLLVENQGPWDCTVFPLVEGEAAPLPEAVLLRGADKGLKLIEELRECIERDEFPGIASKRNLVLETPSWEMDDEDEEMIFDD
jgi:hypothetical protein